MLKVNMEDWLEYGLYSVVKVVGVNNSMLVGHIFIPNTKGHFQYVGKERISRNLVQGYFNNQQIIKEMEELLC